MINEYNNPNLISCMFPTLFPFGIGVLEMANRVVKVSLQMHVKHLLNLDKTKYAFSKHHLFPFFVFNKIQHRQICLGAKLIVSKSSNMNERDLLNNLQTTNFDDIFKNRKNIKGNPIILSLLQHLKVSSKHVMAFSSSQIMQRDQIFSMVNFIGPPSLFFTLNPTFVHHPLVVLLSG